MPVNQTTAEQEAFERGFRAGWEARGNMATPPNGNMGCSVCGMKGSGPMGYVCPRMDCPTMPRMSSAGGYL